MNENKLILEAMQAAYQRVLKLSALGAQIEMVFVAPSAAHIVGSINHDVAQGNASGMVSENGCAVVWNLRDEIAGRASNAN